MRGREFSRRINLILFALSLSHFGLSDFAFGNPHCAKALIAAFQTRNQSLSPQLIESLNSKKAQEIMSQVRRAKLVIIFADHDGTFKEHERNSEAVWPTTAEIGLIQEFEKDKRFRFVFITGRPMDWFYARYGNHDGIGISANHGVVEKPINAKDWMPLHGLAEDWKDTLPFLQEYLRKIPESRIEHKLGFVFHWKENEKLGGVALQMADEMARELYARLNENFQGRPVRFAWSDKGRYFEILPEDSRMGKGEAVLRNLREFLGDDLNSSDEILVISAGDESSDNEMHAVIRELEHQVRIKSISLKVGENHLNQTTAEFWLRSPADFQKLLRMLLEK